MKFVFYDWAGLNTWIFHAINDLRGSLIDNAMLLGTRLGDYRNFPLYLAVATVCGLIATFRNPRQSDHAIKWLAVLAIFTVGYLIDGQLVAFLKPWLDYPRPLVALNGDAHVVGMQELDHSLPSGHSAFIMLFAASFWPVATKPYRILLATLALWVGVSRISLGAHFPADVMAGFLLSFALVFILRRLVEWGLGMRFRITPIQ